MKSNMSILWDDINQSIKSLDTQSNVFHGKHIVITGATGQIGKYLVNFLKRLNELGYGCTVDVVSRNAKHAMNLFGNCACLNYITHDFEQYGACFEPSKPADLIIAGASPTSPYAYNNVPVKVAQTNLNCTVQMLELSKKYGSSILLLSSSSIYGSADDREVHENDYGALDPLQVSACYSESKRACEMLFSAYHHQFGIATYIVRLRRIYGSTMHLSQNSYLDTVFRAAAKGEYLETFRDAANKLQLTYIADAVNGIVYVLSKGKVNLPYNICANDLVTVDEFTAIAYETGKKYGMRLRYLEKEDIRDSVRVNNKNRNNGRCLSEQLKSLGWRQAVTIRQGINRTILALRETFDETER